MKTVLREYFPLSQSRLLALVFASLLSILLNGCAIYTVADTAVSIAAIGVKTTAKVVGGAAGLMVDAVTPSDDEDEEKLAALKRICERNPDHSECRALADD